MKLKRERERCHSYVSTNLFGFLCIKKKRKKSISFSLYKLSVNFYFLYKNSFKTDFQTASIYCLLFISCFSPFPQFIIYLLPPCSHSISLSSSPSLFISFLFPLLFLIVSFSISHFIFFLPSSPVPYFLCFILSSSSSPSHSS